MVRMADSRRNPFPGMNPYAERFWSAIVKPLSVYVADALAENLPSQLATRIEKREFEETIRGVTGTNNNWYVTVVDLRSPAVPLVTVVHFVNASDKAAGSGRDAYLRHRAKSLAAGANVVEIDLVRGGEPVTFAGMSAAPPRPVADYHAGVRRVVRPGAIDYWPIRLRESFPKLPVPIARGQPDLILDLKPHFDRAYTTGRYDDLIDYTRPPEPALSPEDAVWANEVLRDAGLR